MQNVGGSAAAGAEVGVTRVLVVGASAAAAAWPSTVGPRLEVVHAPDIDTAAAQLHERPVDVVVVDGDPAAAGAAELSRLRAVLGRASLLVLSSDCPGDDRVLTDDVGGAVCLVPAGVPPQVQAQLVALAAERARLEQLLEQQARELARSRSHFRDVIERNADAIVVVDREGTIRFANAMAAQLFDTSREALAGSPFGFPLTAGETTELDLLSPGGARVVEMRVVESEWEGAAAYIASLRDTTERRQAEENARRLIREQEARSAAEAAARRYRFQADASARLTAATSYAAVLTALARLCADEIADWAVIYAVDDQGVARPVDTAHCEPARADLVQQLREFPIDDNVLHPVHEVLRAGRPLLVRHADESSLATLAPDPRRRDILRRLGVVSFLIVPLVARGRALGAIKLVSATPDRVFGEQDVAAANDLALRAALALDNARLVQAAQHANQAKSDLLAVISHDLRTPLNAILGYAEILSMGITARLDDAALRHVDRMSQSARHLLYLIDELSSFARLEAGRAQLRVQSIDARLIVREVAAVAQPLAAERGLDFFTDVPDAPLPLRTDPDRVRQVLLNLVGNAVKYTERGAVHLELAADPDGAVLRVRDTGIGIRPEHIGRIFEPFWQADETQRANSRGTGLGLSIVQRLVAMLGGRIHVDSAPGAGTRFTVRLPLEPAPGA